MRVTLVFFFLLLAFNGVAQTNYSNYLKLPEIIPPTPEAASLGKYGNIPVTTYNGMADISIPLHEIKVRDLTVPITLSYHPSGIKVKEESSWAGLGWTVNYGGSIVKTVFDKDDFEYRYFRDHWLMKNFPTTSFCHPTGDWFTYFYEPYAHFAAEAERWDLQPDVYYYNFLGHSGKFAFDQSDSEKPHIIGKVENLNIRYNAGKFTVKTAEGVVLYFNSSVAGRTWQVEKIVTPKGDSITFEYEYEQRIPTSSQTTLSVARLVEAGPATIFACGNEGEIVSSGSSLNQVPEYLPSRINYPGGSVEFKASLTRDDLPNQYVNIAAYKLDSVIVNEATKKKLSFAYDYFTTYSSFFNRTYKRLKLNSVQETGKPPYVFSYSSHLLDAKDLKGDDWGYSNDVSLENLGPSTTLRDLYTASIKAGSLERIQYPTGGYTEFELEPHTYRQAGIDYNNPDTDIILEGRGYDSANVHIREEPYFNVDVFDPDAYNMGSAYIIVESRLRPIFGISVEQLDQFYVTVGGNKFCFAPGSRLPGKYIVQVKEGQHQLKVNFPPGFQGEAWIKVRYHRFRFGGGLRVKRIKDYDGVSTAPVKVTRYAYGKEVTDSQGRKVEGKPYGRLMSRINKYVYYNKQFSDIAYCSRVLRYESDASPLGTSALGSHVGYDTVIVYQGENGENGRSCYTYINDPEASGNGPLQGLPSAYNSSNGALLSETMYNANGKIVRQIVNDYQTKLSEEFYGASASQDPVYIAASYWNNCTEEYSSCDNCPGGTWPIPVCCAESRFFLSKYPLVSSWHTIAKTTEKTYDPDLLQHKTSVTNYFYDNEAHKLPTRIKTINHIGDSLISYTLYPADYNDGIGYIHDLKSYFIHNTPIEQVTLLKKTSGEQKIISAKVTTYVAGRKGLPDEILLVEDAVPVDLEDFKFSNASAPGQLPFTQPAENFMLDPKYKLRLKQYHDMNNNLQSVHRSDDISISYIWGYQNQYPIAKVENSLSNQVFHTSFEDGDEGNSAADDAKTGIRSRVGGYSTQLTGLSPGDYVFSYWSKEAGAWTLHSEEVTVSGSTHTITILGQVDEIRFYPKGALMNTYTYNTAVGITSITDANNQTLYYEYDSSGRLEVVRDENRHILKKYTYQYYNQNND